MSNENFFQPIYVEENKPHQEKKSKLFRWDVFGYDPEEEHPRPEYLAKLRNLPVTKNKLFYTWMLVITCSCCSLWNFSCVKMKILFSCNRVMLEFQSKKIIEKKITLSYLIQSDPNSFLPLHPDLYFIFMNLDLYPFQTLVR